MRASLRVIVVGSAGWALAMSAGCGASRSAGHAAHTSAGPTSAAQLYARMLTDAKLPQGFVSMSNKDMPTVAPSPAPPASEPCSQVDLAGSESVFQNVAPPAAIASSDIDQRQKDKSGRPTWNGWEWLEYYPADGAHHAMEMARALVRRCPRNTVSTPTAKAVITFALAPGPRLGNESFRIDVRFTYADTDGRFGQPQVRDDLIAIRSGDVLILVGGSIMPLSYPDPLNELVGDAYRAYVTTHT